MVFINFYCELKTSLDLLLSFLSLNKLMNLSRRSNYLLLYFFVLKLANTLTVRKIQLVSYTRNRNIIWFIQIRPLVTRPLLLHRSSRRPHSSISHVADLLLHEVGELVYLIDEASWRFLSSISSCIWNRLWWLNWLSIGTLAMMCSAIASGCCTSFLIRIFYATLWASAIRLTNICSTRSQHLVHDLDSWAQLWSGSSMINDLASINLSDLLIPLAKLSPPLLLPELLELLFYALFFLLTLVLANVRLDQSVHLFRVLCLISRGDWLWKIGTLAFYNSWVGVVYACSSRCCSRVGWHYTLHLRGDVVSYCLETLVVWSRLWMGVILTIWLNSWNNWSVCDCRGSVSSSQPLLLLSLTKAGLNFKLRCWRSVATAAVSLIIVILVDLRIKSDRREMPQQLPAVQEVTFTQLFGDRGTIFWVFTSGLRSWRASFWGCV